MKSRGLKGWQILLIAVLFIIIGTLTGGLVGSFVQVGGYILVLFSISTGIRNLIKKKNNLRKRNTMKH